MKLGERPEQKIFVISSGSVGLDNALGVGGYPKDALLKSLVPNLQVRQL